MTTKQAEKAPTPDPVELARAEVQRLNEQELELSRLYRAKSSELSIVRAKRGDDVLKASDPSAAARDSSRQVAVLIEELAALGDAAAAARRQRLTAIPAVCQAEALELDRQAAQLDVDAVANEAAVRDALKAVEQLADCTYVPQPPRAPDRAVGAGQSGVGSIAIFNRPTPLFQRLRLRAEGLRLEAAQRRFKEPHKAGSVEAESLDQLLDVVFSDAMRIGPSVDAISAWAEKAIELEQRRRERLASTADGFVPANTPVRLHLEWRSGQVDVAASFVRSSMQSAPDVQAHAAGNVLFESSTAEQAIDTEREHAAAVASEQSG